jgi:hypothetical protein
MAILRYDTERTLVIHSNRPPAAIRLSRPYASEKEFVEGDLPFLGRATLFLPNVPARGAGEIVRFEFLLSTGAPVFRGEAQVVAHHPAAGTKPAGLEVRITRMDAKSKSIHDHVKERRLAGARSSPKSVAPNRATESMAPAKVGPPPVEVSLPTLAAPRVAPVASAVAARAAEPPPEAPSERSGIHLSPARPKVAPPPNRDEILDRLRERARQLAAKGALPLPKKTRQSA